MKIQKKNNKNIKSIDISTIPGRGWAMDGRVLAMDWRGLACKEFASGMHGGGWNGRGYGSVYWPCI